MTHVDNRINKEDEKRIALYLRTIASRLLLLVSKIHPLPVRVTGELEEVHSRIFFPWSHRRFALFQPCLCRLSNGVSKDTLRFLDTRFLHCPEKYQNV